MKAAEYFQKAEKLCATGFKWTFPAAGAYIAVHVCVTLRSQSGMSGSHTLHDDVCATRVSVPPFPIPGLPAHRWLTMVDEAYQNNPCFNPISLSRL